MRTLMTALLIVFMSLAIHGCASDDDESTGQAFVEGISADDNTLLVGEGTVMTVDFSFDGNDVFGDDRNVVLVVKLPPGVSYREGTSEIEETGSDNSIGAQVTPCLSSGETFLVYDMDRFDLDSADSPGDADARLKFTIDAVASVGLVAIEARADIDSTPFRCGSPFFPDDQAVLTVGLLQGADRNNAGN